MRKIKWRRLQICRSCHRARRAPRRRDGGDSLFTAKTLSDLRAAHAAQRLPSLCKPGGLQVAFFCASWVERCDKTPIHTKDTLRVAPLWSCVMDSQGRAPPRSEQNRLVHGCVHNVGWLIFPSKLTPVVVCSLECDPLIVHILTSSFVTCCGCEMSLAMLFCAVIVEIDFMSSLPCGKKLKFCTLYLRSATVSTSSQFCNFLCEFPRHGVVSTGRAPPSLAMAVVATLIVFVCSPKAKR